MVCPMAHANGCQRTLYQDIRREPRLHVAAHRLYADRLGACHRLPERRLHGRYRHHSGIHKQALQLLAWTSVACHRLVHHRKLYVLPAVWRHHKQGPQGDVRPVHDGRGKLHARPRDERAPRVGAIHDLLKEEPGNSRCHRHTTRSRCYHPRRTWLVHGAGNEGALHTRAQT